MTIHLTKPMTLKGAEVSEPAIDFEALTGADLVAVEREVRVMGGDSHPHHRRVHAVSGGGGRPHDRMPRRRCDAMPAADFKAVIAQVMRFLLA